MAQPPTIERFTVDSIEPIVKLFKDRNVSLEDTGSPARHTAGTYTNGNTKLLGCAEFALTSQAGKVVHCIPQGATVTFYQKPSYRGIQMLCLVEDHAGQRILSITGEYRCKVRDTRPLLPPAPTSLQNALRI